jgi:hypothetical protein
MEFVVVLKNARAQDVHRHWISRHRTPREHLKAIDMQIPPNVPVEELAIPPEQLTVIQVQVLQLLATVERLAASVEKTKELSESPG